VSISSNFGKKQMAKRAKLSANSLKLFLLNGKNFVQILYKNVLEKWLFCHLRKNSHASHEKATHKLLMKLTLESVFTALHYLCNL
jgi:hypothetical protein